MSNDNPEYISYWEHSTIYNIGDRVLFQGTIYELKKVMRNGEIVKAFVSIESDE